MSFLITESVAPQRIEKHDFNEVVMPTTYLLRHGSRPSIDTREAAITFLSQNAPNLHANLAGRASKSGAADLAYDRNQRLKERVRTGFPG